MTNKWALFNSHRTLKIAALALGLGIQILCLSTCKNADSGQKPANHSQLENQDAQGLTVETFFQSGFACTSPDIATCSAQTDFTRLKEVFVQRYPAENFWCLVIQRNLCKNSQERQYCQQFCGDLEAFAAGKEPSSTLPTVDPKSPAQPPLPESSTDNAAQTNSLFNQIFRCDPEFSSCSLINFAEGKAQLDQQNYQVHWRCYTGDVVKTCQNPSPDLVCEPFCQALAVWLASPTPIKPTAEIPSTTAPSTPVLPTSIKTNQTSDEGSLPENPQDSGPLSRCFVTATVDQLQGKHPALQGQATIQEPLSLPPVAIYKMNSGKISKLSNLAQARIQSGPNQSMILVFDLSHYQIESLGQAELEAFGTSNQSFQAGSGILFKATFLSPNMLLRDERSFIDFLDFYAKTNTATYGRTLASRLQEAYQIETGQSLGTIPAPTSMLWQRCYNGLNFETQPLSQEYIREALAPGVRLNVRDIKTNGRNLFDHSMAGTVAIALQFDLFVACNTPSVCSQPYLATALTGPFAPRLIIKP